MVELTVRDKKMLVAGIKDSYQRAKEAWTSAIEQSIACGGELIYVKGQLDHGQWLPFLEACGIPRSTATELMRMSANSELLRNKSATTWAEAKRIISEANRPNGGCTSHLTSQPASESADPNVQSVVRLEAKPVVEVVAPEPIVTEQPVSVVEPQREVLTGPASPDDVAQIIREAMHKRLSTSPDLSPDAHRRMESIESAVDLIGSLDRDDELDVLADLLLRRIDHTCLASLCRQLSVACSIPDISSMLFGAIDFEEDGAEKDGYVDAALKKAFTLKIGEEKAAEVLSGETSLRWAKSEPVPA